MINEAIYGVIAVDTVMKLGMNHPMGPLTLADFIGPTSASHSQGAARALGAIRHTVRVPCSAAWSRPDISAGRAARASTSTEEKDVLLAFVIRHSAFRPRLSADC
jgi:3-hydroxyacyl-CoA dehydrogenase